MHNKTRDEMDNWHQHYRDERKAVQIYKEAFIEQEKKLKKAEAENARLRDIAERALRITPEFELTLTQEAIRAELEQLTNKTNEEAKG